MLIDRNIGGAVDGTAGADLASLSHQVAAAQAMGVDGVWTTEVGRDPFLPLALAARESSALELGTAVAIAFARNPMTVAVTANDLQALSGGRFHLGLGSQVKAHVTRRYSMPWSDPAGRMREFILALRAIWNCWREEAPLRFEGRFYTHTLMTPMFRPTPHPYADPPVLLAAVGARMTTVAAEVADGLLAHSFITERYVREVTGHVVADGLRAAGRRRSDFALCVPGLVATGCTDEEIERAVERVRAQIAFYASTPAYRGVLDLHGLGDLHEEFHRLSKLGEWPTMTRLVDEDVLDLFAVVGRPAEAAAEITKRFSGVADRFTICTPYPVSEEALGELVAGLRRP